AGKLEFRPQRRQAHFLCVTGEYVPAIDYDRRYRVHVRYPLGSVYMRCRRDALDAGQAQVFEHADVEPADIELPKPDREFGGAGKGVMVVVQLFAPDENSNGEDVPGRVGGLEVAIAPVVANAVDNA